MKVKSLEINNFRHFLKNQTIEFWENLTVISWQNSTWKSSILWWIAQAFNYKWKEKTINNKNFFSEYSEVFKFCDINDFDKKYVVTLNYSDDGNNNRKKYMSTRTLKVTQSNKKIRFRVDYDRTYSEGDKRALNLPVIYLWLRRLIPLATDWNVSQYSPILEDTELKEFEKLSKEILILLDKNIAPSWVKSKNKQFLAIETRNYSHLWNSAWQDNIGQIITAMLSLKRLKKWWLLLIDEIDATLYAWSQIHLVDFLFKFSKSTWVQVIFTTHSLEILEHISEKFSPDKLKGNPVVPSITNFLELKDDSVVNSINPWIKNIRNNIKIQTSQKHKIEKIKVLCEDELWKLWCSNLINGSWYSSKVEILWLGETFSDWDLKKMARSKHNFLKDIRFVIDWDSQWTSNEKLPRTVFLPWKVMPEKIFYNFLKNLSDYDDFWNSDINFTKQVCFYWFININEKDEYKNWFYENKRNGYFWKGCTKLFNCRKKSNPIEVKEFIISFKEILNS